MNVNDFKQNKKFAKALYAEIDNFIQNLLDGDPIKFCNMDVPFYVNCTVKGLLVPESYQLSSLRGMTLAPNIEIQHAGVNSEGDIIVLLGFNSSNLVGNSSKPKHYDSLIPTSPNGMLSHYSALIARVLYKQVKNEPILNKHHVYGNWKTAALIIFCNRVKNVYSSNTAIVTSPRLGNTCDLTTRKGVRKECANLLKDMKEIYKHGLYGSFRRKLLNVEEVLNIFAFISMNRNVGGVEFLSLSALDDLLTPISPKLWLTEFKDMDINPFKIQIRELIKLYKCIPYEQNGVFTAMINLLHVFRTTEHVMHLCNRHELSVHDAGQFVPDLTKDYSQDWIHVFTESPKLLRMIGYTDEIISHYGKVPESPAVFKEVMGKLTKTGSWLPDLIEEGATERELGVYKSFITNNQPKDTEYIPAPGGVKGITKGKYHFKQLAFNDPMQLYAGRLTMCCQHLHSAAKSCAIAAYVQPTAGIWAVFKDDKMVAQAFVWRSTNTIVLDSIEYIKCDYSIVSDLFVAAAKDVIGKLGVEIVAVNWEDGSDEVTEAVVKKSNVVWEDGQELVIECPDPVFELDHSDTSDTLIVIATSNTAIH